MSPHLSQLQELKLCGTVSVVKDVLEADDSRRHLHLHTSQENDELTYKHNITKHGVPVSWYRNLEDVPHGFSCIIAYELFDAFPIHKLQVREFNVYSFYCVKKAIFQCFIVLVTLNVCLEI